MQNKLYYCNNIYQISTYEYDEKEEMATIFQQTFDKIENAEAYNEFDNCIADAADATSVCAWRLDQSQEELATPGPSETAKRRWLP